MKQPVYLALGTALLALASAIPAVQAAYVSESDIDIEPASPEFFSVTNLTGHFITNMKTDTVHPTRLNLVAGTAIQPDTSATNMRSLAFNPDRDSAALDEKSAEDVPLPPSAWLFGFGFLGLAKLGRRKKTP